MSQIKAKGVWTVLILLSLSGLVYSQVEEPTYDEFYKYQIESGDYSVITSSLARTEAGLDLVTTFNSWVSQPPQDGATVIYLTRADSQTFQTILGVAGKSQEPVRFRTNLADGAVQEYNPDLPWVPDWIETVGWVSTDVAFEDIARYSEGEASRTLVENYDLSNMPEDVKSKLGVVEVSSASPATNSYGSTTTESLTDEGDYCVV